MNTIWIVMPNIVLLFVPLIAGSLFKHSYPEAAVKVSKVLGKMAFPAPMFERMAANMDK